MDAGSAAERIIRAVNGNLLLVLISAAASTAFGDGIWTYLALCGFVAAILVNLIIYVRITALLEERVPPSVAVIFHDHLRNYLVVIVLLALPVWMYVVSTRLLGTAGPTLWVKDGMLAAIAAITIYVLPIVFLKRVGLVAISAGILYVARSLNASSWIVGIALLASLLGSARYLALYFVPNPWAIAPILILGVLANYLHFVAFAAAVDALVRSKPRIPSVA